MAFRFLSGVPSLVVSHGMSGFWDASDEPWTFNYVEGDRRPSLSNVRMEIGLTLPTGTQRTLLFHDDRLFARSRRLTRGREDAGLGPEVLLTGCTSWRRGLDLETFSHALLSRHPVKSLLMDGKLMAGVGNIYSSEALWRTRVHPTTPGHMVRPPQVVDLFGALGDLLDEAILNDLDYSKRDVYRKESCPTCSTRIACVDVKGRSSYFCPSCQVL